MRSLAQTSLLLVWVLVSLYAGDIRAFPSGAPTYACSSMKPNAGAHGAAPQSRPSPYWLGMGTDRLPPGTVTVNVTVNGPDNSDIRGILLQARDLNTFSILGEFLDLDNTGDFKGVDCPGTNSLNSAVTHANRNDKDLPLTFTWLAPEMDGEVMFIATIVDTKPVYWVNITSSSLALTSCSQIQGQTAALCASHMRTRINSDVTELLDGSMDIFTFCRRLESHHNTFTNCTSSLPEECEFLLAASLELYQNTSTQYCDCSVHYNCLVDPCDVIQRPTCPEAQWASCISNYCGGCWAVWVDTYNNTIDCSAANRTHNMTTVNILPSNGAGTYRIGLELLVGTGLLWLFDWVLM